MIDSNNLPGETGFSLAAGLSATGGSDDGEKSAKHCKNKVVAFSCYNRPCCQKVLFCLCRKTCWLIMLGDS